MAEVLAVPPVLNQYQKYVKPKLVDEEFRKKRYKSIGKYNLQRYHADEEFHDKLAKKVRERNKLKYQTDDEYREKRKQQMRENYHKKKMLNI